MSHLHTKEAAFETVIESHLLANGYQPVSKNGYDKGLGIFPQTVIGFIKDTQLKEWQKLEALLGTNTEQQVLQDLCRWMDNNGSLNTLRHGFKCYGRMLQIAFFKAAHTMNPELEKNYAANVLGITRQLQYSAKNTNSLDVTLSVNGVPVAIIELKSAFTGQTAENAKQQYKTDRDPRELLFEFKRRTLVHFAVDTEQVFMTTRLAGGATYFLPFNKGNNGSAGNPADPNGRTYCTA